MKYIIFVRNEEENKNAQKILFAAGVVWSGGQSVGAYKDQPFLIVTQDKMLLYSTNFAYAAGNHVKEHNYTPIDFCDVAQIFPPLQPEKMIEVGGKQWSESTLKEMIKRYANE